MRIVQVSNYMPDHVGGIESVANDLASTYRAAGHQVTWLAALPHGCSHSGPVDDVPVRAWNVTERRLGFPYPLPSPIAVARLHTAIKECDVVHLHDSLYALNVAAMVAARRHGRGVLLTQHVGPVRYRSATLNILQRSAYARLGTKMMRSADRVVFVSKAVCAMFPHVTFRADPIVIENGVDERIFHPRPRSHRRGEAVVLAYAGRFVEKKRITILSELLRMNPSWSLRIAGSDDPGELARLPTVTFLGKLNRNAVAEEFARASVVVIPSRDEGFPVAAQEALLCGTPVVVAAATADRLTSRPPGLYAAATDDPESFAKAIRAATAGDDAAAVARSAAGRWSSRIAASNYLALLTEIAPTRGAARDGGAGRNIEDRQKE